MIKRIIKISGTSLLAAISIAFLVSISFAIEPIKPVTPISPDKLRKPIPIPTCPDLEARLTESHSLSGRNLSVSLRGQVCNVGTADYVSPPLPPAHATLAKYDPSKPLTSGNYQVMTGRDITNLSKTACVSINGSFTDTGVIQIGWREPVMGECKKEREFSLSIGRNVLDDIVWRSNEDCKGTNNQAKVRVQYMVECPW